MLPPARPVPLGHGQFFGDPSFRRELPGFSLARVVASRSSREVPEHVHETAHAVIVLEGRYTSDAARPEAGRAPGLIWNPPGTAHRDRFLDRDGVFLTVSVSEARLSAFGSARLPVRPIALASGPALRASRHLARALRCWPRRSTLRAERLCHALLDGLVTERLLEREPPAWLRAARETLAARYDEPLRVAEIAAQADVHPVHLIRSFRRFFGRTPHAFLRERRLESASTLLRTTSLALVEIALRTGFADQSHFTRAFTRRFGTAPAAFRRNARKPG